MPRRKSTPDSASRKVFSRAKQQVNSAKISIMHAGNARRSCTKRFQSLQRAAISLGKAEALLKLVDGPGANQLEKRARELAAGAGRTADTRFKDACLR